MYQSIIPTDEQTAESSDASDPQPVTPASSANFSKENMLFCFQKPQTQNALSQNPQSQKATSKFRIDTKIDEEIVKFSLLIENKENRSRSSNNFWDKYKGEMPKLFDLFLKLSNIPSTSAGVERFFSISGLVCDKRRLTMREDLIEYRSMIKANMYTLDNICLNK